MQIFLHCSQMACAYLVNHVWFFSQSVFFGKVLCSRPLWYSFISKNLWRRILVFERRSQIYYIMYLGLPIDVRLYSTDS